LRELVIWRNEAAREADLPPRAYLRDEVLISLAREPVKSADRLGRVRGLPRPVESRWSGRIVAATLKGLADAGQTVEPRGIEPTPRQRFAADALWAAAQAISAARQIDPALVFSRQDIAGFYHAVTEPNQAEVEKSRIMRGWRRAAVGDALVGLITGQKQFTLSWRDGGLAGL
jgi:ribonuclease D